MDSIIHIAIVLVVGIVGGLLLAFIRLTMRHFKNARNVPQGDRREQLISVLADMKTKGKNYNERMAFLQDQGIRKDVADALLGELESRKQ